MSKDSQTEKEKFKVLQFPRIVDAEPDNLMTRKPIEGGEGSLNALKPLESLKPLVSYTYKDGIVTINMADCDKAIELPAYTVRLIIGAAIGSVEHSRNPYPSIPENATAEDVCRILDGYKGIDHKSLNETIDSALRGIFESVDMGDELNEAFRVAE